jgi:hypothetical protein
MTVSPSEKDNNANATAVKRHAQMMAQLPHLPPLFTEVNQPMVHHYEVRFGDAGESSYTDAFGRPEFLVPKPLP